MNQNQKLIELISREKLMLTVKEISESMIKKEKEIETISNQYEFLKKIRRQIEENIDNACFENPKEGDSWHEMYVPVVAVIQVHEDKSLTICEHTKDVEDNKYIFDIFDTSKVRKITRQEFEKKIKWCKNKIGYKVIPERCVGILKQWHMWIAENL